MSYCLLVSCGCSVARLLLVCCLFCCCIVVCVFVPCAWFFVVLVVVFGVCVFVTLVLSFPSFNGFQQNMPNQTSASMHAASMAYETGSSSSSSSRRAGTSECRLAGGVHHKSQTMHRVEI